MRALFRHFEHLWQRRKAKKQKALPNGSKLDQELIVKLTNVELISLQLWCERVNENPSTWLRQKALESIPVDFKKQIREALKGITVENVVLDDLDKEAWEHQEQDEGVDVQEPKRPEDNPMYQELISFPRVEDHSCYHLRKVFRGRLGPGMCSGTCASPDPAATGKICQFPSAVAPHCIYYEPTGKERKNQQRRAEAR